MMLGERAVLTISEYVFVILIVFRCVSTLCISHFKTACRFPHLYRFGIFCRTVNFRYLRKSYLLICYTWLRDFAYGERYVSNYSQREESITQNLDEGKLSTIQDNRLTNSRSQRVPLAYPT